MFENQIAMNANASSPLSPAEIAELFGQSTQALYALNHTKRLDDKSQATLYSMACMQMQLGRFEKALQYFNFLHFYVPDSEDYLRGLGFCAAQLQSWELAANAFGTALYLNPQSYSLALSWAEALLHIDLKKVAREILLLVVQEATVAGDVVAQERASRLLQSLPHEVAEHATA